MKNRLFNFVGGNTGDWRVVRIETVVGTPLAEVARVEIIEGENDSAPENSVWRLRGVTSYERYVTRAEKDSLIAVQEGLNRPAATCAALIPIRKSAAWWELAQDDRRAILETNSKHIATGLKYLPAIARRLHHSRELGEEFDFLTWFEYAPEDAGAFDELVGTLRGTEEWNYVERQVDIRLVRAERL